MLTRQSNDGSQGPAIFRSRVFWVSLLLTLILVAAFGALKFAPAIFMPILTLFSVRNASMISQTASSSATNLVVNLPSRLLTHQASVASSTVTETAPSLSPAADNGGKPEFYQIRDGHVYCDGAILANADASTFARVFSVPELEDEGISSLYNVGKDKSHVYSECSVLTNADPGTFYIVFSSDGQWTLAAKDAQHVYYAGIDVLDGSASLELFPSADAGSFRVFGDFADGYSEDKNVVWRFDNVTRQPVVVQGADSTSFHVLLGQGSSNIFDWGADRNHVYYDGRVVDQANSETFSLICSAQYTSFSDVKTCIYGTDSSHVYVLTAANGSENVAVLANADPATFVLVDPPQACGPDCYITAKDSVHYFNLDQTIP